MITRIVSSTDSYEYRDYQINNCGEYFEIIELSTGERINTTSCKFQAEKYIDQLYTNDSEDELAWYDSQINYNTHMMQQFAEYADVSIDKNNYIIDETMKIPGGGKKFDRMYIKLRSLRSILKSFNRRNSTHLDVEETKHGFRLTIRL